MVVASKQCFGLGRISNLTTPFSFAVATVLPLEIALKYKNTILSFFFFFSWSLFPST